MPFSANALLILSSPMSLSAYDAAVHWRRITTKHDIYQIDYVVNVDVTKEWFRLRTGLPRQIGRSCGVENTEVVPQVAKCLIGVGRVPDCAMRKKKPDTDLLAFCVTRSVTLEADLLSDPQPLERAPGHTPRFGGEQDPSQFFGRFWVFQQAPLFRVYGFALLIGAANYSKL
jgi:hypothetical protein